MCYLPDYLGSFTNAVGVNSQLQNGANEKNGDPFLESVPLWPFQAVEVL